MNKKQKEFKMCITRSEVLEYLNEMIKEDKRALILTVKQINKDVVSIVL